MKDGRTKGNKFENDVCRLLATWSGVPESIPLEQLPFRRRSTSVTPVVGHWRGAGDIVVAESVRFRMCVECKKHEGWTLDHLFLPKSVLWQWWDQTKKQATAAKLLPLLAFSRNRCPVYAMVSLDTRACNASGMLVDRPGTDETVRVATFASLMQTAFPR